MPNLRSSQSNSVSIQKILSLRLLKFSRPVARLFVAAVAIFAAIVGWYFVRWNFVNAVADNGIDAKLPEARFVADWLIRTAPDDPQAHVAAAAYYETTFEEEDLDRSTAEYETAVALSPYDSSLWLLLGRSKYRNGDTDGAAAAYRRALELAPTYAPVKWAYGNFLIRSGNADQGLVLIADAARSQPRFADQAATISLQAFDNDLARARAAMGDSPALDGAFTNTLGGQGRYDEALQVWSAISDEDKVASQKEVGERLLSRAIDSHHVRVAAKVSASLSSDASERPSVGQVMNGGFEQGVKLRNARYFDWQIGDGTEPQIGLSDGAKHSGSYSLWLTFNSFETAGFRDVSQVVAAEPGRTYELTGFYRAELKTKAVFTWQVVDVASSTELAVTEPLAFAGDWTTFRTRFTVPASSDGVVIRFQRLGCGTGACPVTGKMAFDDLAISEVQR